MSNIIEYRVIREKDIDELYRGVKRMEHVEYVQVGELVITGDDEEYCQAMIRKSGEKE